MRFISSGGITRCQTGWENFVCRDKAELVVFDPVIGFENVRQGPELF